MADASYIDPQSIVTLGGASVGVMAVANTFYYATGFPGRWSGLIISFAVVFLTNPPSGGLGLLLDVINGCVLFCTSLGISNTVLGGRAGSQGFKSTKAKGRTWNHDWWHD